MTTTALPSHLFDSYKQYKRQTARLASWLGTTSQSLGYTFADIPSAKAPAPGPAAANQPASTTTAGGGRPKGKARKPATAAPSAPTPASSSDDPDSSTPTTIMTTRDFITLADFICAKDPPVTVPARVIDWACRAIQSRRVCAAWFNAVKDASAATEDSNQTHAHFIGILEQVVEILAPRVGIAPQHDKAEGKKELEAHMSGVELLASRFAALAVDDEAGDEENDGVDGDEDGEWAAVFAMVQETLTGKKAAQSGGKGKGKGGKGKGAGKKKPAKPLTPSPPRRKYQVKYEDDEEMLFAYLDLLRELESVRDFVKDLWSKYSRSEIKLEVASTTTTAAVDKVQLKLDALYATYPKLAKDNGKHARMVFDRMCAIRNQPSAPANKSSGDLVDTQVWDLAEFTYLPMIEVLDRTRVQIATSSKPSAYQSPRADPATRAVWSQKDKLANWTSELVQVYRSCKQVEARHLPLPVSDHVLAHLSTLATKPATATSKPTPLPLIALFTTKIFCDISDTLAHRQPDAQRDMHAAWYRHKYGLINFMCYPTPRHSALFARNIESWAKEQDLTVLLWSRGQVTGPSVDIPELFAQHAWLAGSVLVYTHLAMRYFAMSNADMWGCVLFSAHMYEASKLARAGGNNTPWWPLMDEFVALVKKESIFYGRVPTDASEAWFAINLAFGVSGYELNAWQRGRQTYARNWKRSDRDPVCVEEVLDEASPLCAAVFQRVFEGASAREWVAEVERVLLKDMNDAAAAAALTSRSTAQAKTRKQLGLFEYLELVRAQVAREQPIMAFNLLELHVQSYRLLVHLRERMYPHLARSGISMSTVTMRDDQLPMITWHVLMGIGAGNHFLSMSGVADPSGATRLVKEMLVECKTVVGGMEKERAEYEAGGYEEYDEMVQEEMEDQWEEIASIMEYFRMVKKQSPNRLPGGIKLFKFKLGRRVSQMEE